ncbi:cyclic nucleotide-binding domain-containing protein [Neosynechococcus sphagnicola]|uniref:cyclic nucleotide-binding domain-containing protein n=1 Tax=Neosynechococcus sphagnicola TaxID=1501145 RepID=UPI000A7DC22B|nr:cyclic nucleotide-binding domain-containing protein [Neosynechococcus sphagnicola]
MGGYVVVPNSNLTSQQVLNWSYQSFKGRIRIPVGASYESDPILVTETLLNAAYMESFVLHDPAPKVVFIGFGDSALQFELWVWVNRIDERISLKSSLNFIIDHQFRQMGITMPFPQQDLWLRNPDALLPGQPQAEEPISDNLSTPPQPPRPAKPVSLRDLLHKIPYFRNCSDLHLRSLIEIGYRKTLGAGEILFREGEPGQAFYLVLCGAIEAVVLQLDKQVKVYSTGEFLGEVALMLGVPYAASARALQDSILFVIDKHNFEKLLRLRPDLTELITQECVKDQEVYSQLRHDLQKLGLLGMPENHQNALEWIRNRFKTLFNL